MGKGGREIEGEEREGWKERGVKGAEAGGEGGRRGRGGRG